MYIFKAVPDRSVNWSLLDDSHGPPPLHHHFQVPTEKEIYFTWSRFCCVSIKVVRVLNFIYTLAVMCCVKAWRREERKTRRGKAAVERCRPRNRQRAPPQVGGGKEGFVCVAINRYGNNTWGTWDMGLGCRNVERKRSAILIRVIHRVAFGFWTLG